MLILDAKTYANSTRPAFVARSAGESDFKTGENEPLVYRMGPRSVRDRGACVCSSLVQLVIPARPRSTFWSIRLDVASCHLWNALRWLVPIHSLIGFWFEAAAACSVLPGLFHLDPAPRGERGRLPI